MNIVKQFEVKLSADPDCEDVWLWGLGEDGALYGRWSYETDNDWELHGITIEEMKRVIKEFGHLVVFT